MDSKIEDDEIAVPKYGLKLKLNHTYPETRSQDYYPRFRQLLRVLPLLIR